MRRPFFPFALLFLCFCLDLPGAWADDAPDRVFPVSTPVPLSAATPSDTVLSMTGDWRFSLTRGSNLHQNYLTTAYLNRVCTASSFRDPTQMASAAFDGDSATNWWPGGELPQWVQTDLGATETVTGAELAWLSKEASYQFKVEGSLDGTSWQMLADKTAAPGVHDGPLSWDPVQARYLRVTLTGVTPKSAAASLWECKILVDRGGQPAVWHLPAMPDDELAKVNAFFDPGFDDSKWAILQVPSNWELSGYSETNYNGADDAVGLYRRTVDVPASFQGKRVLWRFDGVFCGAEIYVNGKRAGYHESGYTAFDVDLTGLVEPGKPNVFAVRVCKKTSSTDLDTGDYETLGGIYRDTFLYAVPETHVSDITVRTDLDSSGDARLEADIEVAGPANRPVPVDIALADGDGKPVQGAGGRLVVQTGADGKGQATFSTPVSQPLLWSAEKPNLYRLSLVLRGSGEAVEQPFGFRKISMEGGVLKWNNVPIKCAGMCRHEIYPTLGAALDDSVWLKDVALLHEANVNAIRTSHYNHAARFLDLCDQKGFYVLDEIPFCWIESKVNDLSYMPAIYQRARETIARDKNRPSVLAWSCGNENPLGKIEEPAVAEVHRLDPTRPAFASSLSPDDLKGQSFADMHYPGPFDIESYVKRVNNRVPIVFTEGPHTFFQSSWRAYDPGVSTLWEEVLSKSWEAVYHQPGIIGSFIWEWQDQPVLDFFIHDGGGGKGMRWQNNKGMVTGDRQPKPEWWTVKMSYSQVHVTSTHIDPSGSTCAVAIDNRYSFTDLKELGCAWEILNGDEVLQKGTQVVECAPRQSVTAQFPALPKMTALHLTFTKADGSNVVDAILKTPDAPQPQPTPPLFTRSGTQLQSEETDTGLRLHNDLTEIRFDKATGQLSSWRFRDQDLVSAPQPFDLGQEFPNGEPGEVRYLTSPAPLTLSGTTWKTEAQDDAVVATAVTAVAYGKENKPIGTLTTSYTVTPDARIAVRWSMHYTDTTARVAWEIGEKFALPERLNKLAWYRDARFLYYPPGQLSAPEGSCASDDVRFRSSKRYLHWLTLTDEKGTGLALLPLDQIPLVGRGGTENGKTVLWASRDISSPHDLSITWVDGHDVHLDATKPPVAGGFILCPVMAGNP